MNYNGKIAIAEVEAFLKQKFEHIASISHLADGWWSSAFYFQASDKEFVIRFGNHWRDFKKDEIAFRLFGSERIPIPQVVEIGACKDNSFYCISEYIPGTPSDHERLAEEAIHQLIAVHQVDTRRLDGWGYIDESGNGIFESWQQFLLSFHNSKQAVTWQELAQRSWLDGSLFSRLIEKMISYFPYLPNDKHLLHGDFGYDNLLIGPDNRIAAVIDWAEMRLGDPLYDLIHLNQPWIENSRINYLDVWKRIVEAPIKDLQQRLHCYKIHYTLFQLHIHTVRGEEDDYRQIEYWAKNNL